MKVAFVPVWQQVTPELAQELMAFWQANKAIVEPGAAANRALQAISIARDEAGVLCGVATAAVKVLPRLRQPMYYYRQYFATALRGQRQELPFFQHAKQVLQDYNAARDAPESLGLLIEIENGKIASAYRRAHEPGFEATFIGYSPRGLQLRVSYFDNAVLLAPSPLRAPALAASGAGANAPRTQPASRRGTGRS
ncbi:MAG: hypothetical protein EOP93_00195 [Lysobacteraceae bacterium]|nr:MAG: hypothetical protein EOP93_00195 [Xanthomonadaceae bacterium]